LGGLTVSNGAEKKIWCENNLQKIKQKLTSAIADAENVTSLHECTAEAVYSLDSSPTIAEISWRMFLISSACILATVSCSFTAELPLPLRQEL
jgi:hypothetical protein